MSGLVQMLRSRMRFLSDVYPSLHTRSRCHLASAAMPSMWALQLASDLLHYPAVPVTAHAQVPGTAQGAQSVQLVVGMGKKVDVGQGLPKKQVVCSRACVSELCSSCVMAERTSRPRTLSTEVNNLQCAWHSGLRGGLCYSARPCKGSAVQTEVTPWPCLLHGLCACSMLRCWIPRL